MHSGRTSEAIPNLRHCAEQIPEFMPARAGLVSALLLNGEEAEAVPAPSVFFLFIAYCN